MREGGTMDATRPAAPAPAEAGVDAVLQARAVHGLIRNDPRMPPRVWMRKLRSGGSVGRRGSRMQTMNSMSVC